MSNIKSYFSFSKSEQRGLLVLMLLVVAFVLAPSFISRFSKPKVWDYSAFATQIDSLERLWLAQQNAEALSSELETSYLFNFNPNTIGFKQLCDLGFSTKQAQVLINYRNAGGVFTSADDVKKVYGVSDALYQRIKPYIKIPEEIPVRHKVKVPDKALDSVLPEIAKPIPVDINLADSQAFEHLYGIGPVFAERIVNYRNALGGFYSVNQLYEVYGLPKETVDQLYHQLTADSLPLSCINLNEASFKTLNKHPYISYKQTKQLVNYRNLMGAFGTLDDILANHLMDSASFYKVQPYLILD